MITISDFKQWQKYYPNDMTPYLVKVKQKGKYFYELSQGTDFNHNKLYGVTVIEWNGKEFNSFDNRLSSKNKPFYSKSEAIKYFNEISA